VESWAENRAKEIWERHNKRHSRRKGKKMVTLVKGKK